MIAILAILALAAGQLPQAQPNSLDIMIRGNDLEDLSESQIARVRALIINLMSHKPSDDTLSQSANSYMARQGYKICHLQMIRVDNADWLVVEETFGRSATEDVPILLDKTNFLPGNYFCKNSIVGISEFIDSDGNAQSLLFAKWVPLR